MAESAGDDIALKPYPSPEKKKNKNTVKKPIKGILIHFKQQIYYLLLSYMF